MSADRPSHDVNVLAEEPTLVVGLGRFGLAVLEELGRTWARCRQVSDDPRLGNFRLLHVRGEQDADPSWRAVGTTPGARKLADATREGDSPVRALDFLFLRCMGLIRLHRGMYQVALARDVGFTAAVNEDDRRTTQLVRTFSWRNLNPDIERANEVLRLELARDPELELFLSPFLGRIRVGQSPRVIADALVRASRYAEGKDPSPWPSLPEQDDGEMLRELDEQDWVKRVREAGSRAPRKAIATAQALGGQGDFAQRFAAPSTLLALELDEEALVHGAGVEEYQHLVGGGTAAGDFVQSPLAARLLSSSDLARHVEVDPAVVGVGRASVVDSNEYESLRAQARALQLDARRCARAVHEARRLVRRVGLTWVEGAKGEVPLERFAASLATLRDHGREAAAVAARFQALRARQERALPPSHPDVLGVLRAEVESFRVATLADLEISNALWGRTLEVQRLPEPEEHAQADGPHPRAHGARTRKEKEDQEKALHLARTALGGEEFTLCTRLADEAATALVARLEAKEGMSAAEPELLAARLLRAEVARGTEAVRGAERDELERVDRATAEGVLVPLARSRRLVALQRLARLEEREGNVSRALALLERVMAESSVEANFPPEHRSALKAHRVVARHARARLLSAAPGQGDRDEALREFEAAIGEVRELLGQHSLQRLKDPDSKTGSSEALARSLVSAEHRAILEAHGVLMEHALAAALVLADGARAAAVDDAIRLMEGLLKDRKTRLGWEHPDTLAMALDLAAALRHRGQRHAAAPAPSAGQGAAGASPQDGAGKPAEGAKAVTPSPREDDLERAERILAAVRGGHAPDSLFDPLGLHPDAFDPRDLLWATSGAGGRASQSDSADGETGCEVVGLPMWLHGFYDALDDDAQRAGAFEDILGGKLKRFGQLCFRGLLDLFWELRNLERPPRSDDEGISDEERMNELLLAQSTDLIAEVLFRAVKDDKADPAAGRPVSTRVEALSLPEFAGSHLRALEPPGARVEDAGLRALDARLAELGALPPEAQAQQAQIFQELRLAPRADIQRYLLSVREARRAFHHLLTQLLDVEFLSRVSERSVGKPPRVQVFIAADLGEPVVRASLRDVLAALHAESLQAFRAVFKEYRGGFARNLSIIPLLWYPNPATAEPAEPSSVDDYIRAVRHEEADMLQSILDLRRDVFRAPSRERFVPTVYVSSRVNDGGVLTLEESVQQTHDFIHLCARSAMGQDDWLRSVLMGPYGRDPFGTFGCVELEFPADRIREYLSGRLARMVMGELLDESVEQRSEPVDEARDAERKGLEARLDEDAKGVHAELGRSCGRLADRAVVGHDPVPEDPDPDEVLAQHSDDRAGEVAQVILGGWQETVAPGCTMDGLMQQLRVEARQVAREATRLVRERSDEEVAAVARGKALASPMLRLLGFAKAEERRLEGRTDEVAAAQARALAEQLPDPLQSVRPAFDAVRAAAEKVPRRPWLRGAELAAAPVGFVLASVAGYALSLHYRWHEQVGLEEVLSTRALPWLGAVAAVALTRWVLEWHRRRRVAFMRGVMEEAVEAVRRVVTGPSHSIQRFLDARVSFLVSTIRRGVAARAEEQAQVDARQVRGLKRAAEAGERDLRRHAEELGVQAEGLSTFASPAPDRLERLVEVAGRNRGALVDGDAVLGYWDDRVGPVTSQRSLMPGVLAAVAGTGTWRGGEWFCSRAALLGYGREYFAELLAEEICDHPRLAPVVGARMDQLARRRAAQLGFPGYLKGAEGLDDDGVLLLAEGDLVTRPRLAALLPGGRSDIRVRQVPVRPHAAYLLTLAQGVAPQLPLMHRRHMGHYDNPFDPSDPIHILTGFKQGVETLFARFKPKPGDTKS